MTAMKSKSILPVLCHLHLSSQHIMITSLSLYRQSVSSHFQRIFNTGRHVLLLSLVTFNCYHTHLIPYENVPACATCIPWNAAYIMMYILHLMTLPKITFLPIQKGSHRTFAAGVDSRQGHLLLWTANPSNLGLA